MYSIDELPMTAAGLGLALWLIVFHLWMLLRKKKSQEFLTKLPRSDKWGTILMVMAMFSFWLLIIPGEEKAFYNYFSLPLGDFNGAKKYLFIFVPFAAYMMIVYVKEFLSVRAIGVLALVYSTPLLYSSYQDWPTGKLLLPIYAYMMIISGLFCVGMPYLFRDILNKIKEKDIYWNTCASAGLVYGVAVLVMSLVFWRGY